MRNKCQFDEKQIFDRGRAFQAGFLAAIITTCATYFLTDVCGVSITSFSLFLISLWIPITVCFILLITKDAYEDVNSSIGKTILSIYGVAGLFILGSTLFSIFIGKEYFLKNGTFSDSLGHIVTAICMIITCVIYWVKRCINARKYRDE